MRVKISTRDNYVVSLYSELSRRYMYSYVLLNLNCNRQAAHGSIEHFRESREPERFSNSLSVIILHQLYIFCRISSLIVLHHILIYWCIISTRTDAND